MVSRCIRICASEYVKQVANPAVIPVLRRSTLDGLVRCRRGLVIPWSLQGIAAGEIYRGPWLDPLDKGVPVNFEQDLGTRYPGVVHAGRLIIQVA